MPSSTSSSEPKGEAFVRQPVDFEIEHVERPIPARPWRMLALIVVVATLVLTAGWEFYWRGKGFLAGDYENTEGLWAQERRKATGDATVIIGSSRAFFDIDLDVWEEVSGVRPVQLSLEGTSPRIFLTDFANDEDFHGQLIVGVTTILFFTQDGGLRASVLDYVRDEAPFERLDHILSKPLERYFAFMDQQTRPKRQVAIWPFPIREGMKPRFDPRKLSISSTDRNTEMWSRVVTDEKYNAEAKSQWLLAFDLFAPPPGPNGEPPAPMPDAAIDAVIAEVKTNVDKIRARGGDVAFVRMPFEGPFADVENGGFPRERFWDRLVERTGAVGVSFQDHPELQGYTIPEWSHLEAREAERFTRAFAPIFYGELAKKNAEAGGQ